MAKDPPAYLSRDLSSGLVSDASVPMLRKQDRYASLEASNSTFEDFGTRHIPHDEAKLIESARECMERYKKATKKLKEQRRKGVSYREEESKFSDGEEEIKLAKKWKSIMSSQTESATLIDEQQLDETVDNFFLKLNEAIGEAADLAKKIIEETKEEPAEIANGTVFAQPLKKLALATHDALAIVHQDEIEKSGEGSLAGFFVTLADFLASVTYRPFSSVLGNACTNPSAETTTTKYEVPLQSIDLKDIDDFGSWDRASMKPTRIADAVNFSSNRLDAQNRLIALYDEARLRQEPHEVIIPEDHFDVDDEYEDYEYSSAEESRDDVPEAIVLNPKKVDDISVLGDTSIYTEDMSKYSVRAWSLSPRRKRRLKAAARAVATQKKDP
jgi:hypothetical protein